MTTQPEQPSSEQQLQTVAETIRQCGRNRQTSFLNRLRKIRNRLKENKNIDSALAQLQQDVDQAKRQLNARIAERPAVSYPQSLPISQQREAIAEAIESSQVVIVAGETGSGKTTQIPKICLQLGRGIHGMIGHTQPRRIAARSVATRIAEELHIALGSGVGFKVRFSDHSKHDPYIKLMTDGILLAELQHDRKLLQYDTIIIDEAHERSLNIDFLLGVIKQLLPKRPDLKLIITSATINTGRFSRFFDDAPIIKVSGRSYPVAIAYRPLPEGTNDQRDSPFFNALIAAVDEAYTIDATGDILIFLPGEREIRDTAHALHDHAMPHSEILPLYSRLSPAEQDRVFKPHTGRRIVLATNVAETSLTVPGIRFVIDSGLARISRYSVQSRVQRLPVETISQASANQRAGRCGRVADGVCFRLYSEEDFNNRQEHTDPEIRRTNLASVILQMHSLGLGAIEHFDFMDPPEKRAISDGYRLLDELQAIRGGQLTDIGRKLVRMPIDPRLARMLIQADKERSLHEVLIIVAALAIQDPRLRPVDAQQQADAKQAIFTDPDSDFLCLLKLWHWYHEQARHLSRSKLKKCCQEHFLVWMRMREWHDLHSQLLAAVREMKMKPNPQSADSASIHRAILAGLLGHVALKHPKKGYLGARNIRVTIFPGSAMAKKGPQWLMAASLVQTSRLFARTIAPIDPAWIEDLAGHLIHRQYSEPHWSRKSGQVMAYERMSLFGLPVVARRRIHFARVDATLARELFIRHALVLHEFHSHAPFFNHNRKLLQQIEQLEHTTRRRDLMPEEQIRFGFFDHIIPDHICTVRSFERWRKEAEKNAPHLLYLNRELLFGDAAGEVDLALYPKSIRIDGVTLKLSYHFDPTHHADGITVRLPLPLLGQLRAERFEWLVPGMLQEKLTALIKSLPKSLRRNFVPAPQFAKACAESMAFAKGALLPAFAAELKRMTGVEVPPREWNSDALPKHLRMNFALLNDHGRVIATDHNLPLLQHRYAQQLRAQTRHLSSDIRRSGITRWDFGQLPIVIEQPHGRSVIRRFPALADRKQSVAIELFENESEASQSMCTGVRRLLMLMRNTQVRQLARTISAARDLQLCYAVIGDCAALTDQIIACTFDAVFLQDQQHMPRSEEAFELLLTARSATIIEQGEALIASLTTTLKTGATLQQSLDHVRAAALKPVVDDIRSQLAHLIYDGFIANTPAGVLQQFPRYLQAAQIRLERAGPNLKQDRVNSESIQRFWLQWQDEIKRRQQQHQPTAPLADFRWQLEELRVALFAQQLKLSAPVSVKRLSQLWAQLNAS